MKKLVVEAMKCTGCRICEQWCSVSHYQAFNPKKARIRVTRNHDTLMNQAAVCHQCADAPCVAACPPKVKALSRNEGTGAIAVDEDKCILCRACIKACPYQAINVFPAAKHVIICDLCAGEPQCVQHCPEGAIRYEDPEATAAVKEAQ